LPHLVAAVRAMPKSAAARDTLGMALRQLKRFSEALVQNSKAVALAPTQARYRENLASTLVGIDSRKSKAQALREFETVLEQHPDRVEAMTGLAALQIRMQQPLAALAVLDRALRLAPDSLDVLVNRAAALSLVGRTEEALACCGRLIELFPDNSIVFNQRGIVREHAGDYEGALADFAVALQAGHGRKPDIIADAEFNHVLLLMSLGRLAEAWPLYQARMNVKSADPRGTAFTGRLPPWDGTVRPGQRILVWGEQGVGDQILFGSMLPELVRAGADVVFGGDPRLVPLFERSIEGLRCEAMGLPIKPDVVDRVAGLADVQAGLGDIGMWLRPDLAAAPPPRAYLKPDPVRVAALRRRYESYGKRHIVGITWRSSNPRIGAMKSVALLDWAPVLTQKDVLFVDMQYGDTAEERAQVRDRLGVDILHDDSIDALKDLDGVVAQAAALDLLVGSSNSGIHMAAAAGTLCWVMVPGGLGRLWYWHLSRSDSPWYPNIRLFRQSAGLAADWRATIEDVAQALRDRLRERPA